MTETLQTALEYAHMSKADFLTRLIELVRIPSISTSPEHKLHMVAAANWLADYLRTQGLQSVQVMPTDGHPVVYAEWLNAPGAPTVLIYGHYDVQPVDPLELWTTDPFTPTQRGDSLYARGASDMKGQVMASIYAVEAILKQGPLPVNVKFMLEGEEEIGSPSLKKWMTEQQELLACDLALNPDTGMIGAEVPTLIYALRGLAYFEIRVFGPERDLHSGVYGGVVHNPAQALAELIAGMHDSMGRITLPGFYDSVLEMDPEERAELARLPMEDTFYQEVTGVPELYGEAGFSPAERVGARPTLEVNGLLSGFTGQGQKTVIPAWAMAKISMRLVPNQDPAEVHRQLLRYLEEHAPSTVRWEVTRMSSSPASITERHSPGGKAMADGLEAVWGKRPLYKREGGSVPVVGDMQRILKADSVLTGFGLPDDNIHSPNEKLHLPTWYRGIDALIHFFYNYAARAAR